ncbi:uncharacterized protein A1O9_04130 [Exophiala aquamarina CBS 119918]|uniref:Hypoxia up-regulated 1 n=1 Tax=Exophiala aquamarina CBS 119918 TaxID=1182545 RepID=A0A072PHI5_9EURO|nr:uncharacterized protein A1O9_04130 [Exophiala aquamarina CBS 119918]KEF59286.1 hypothetical protein A1O9_04130 [Exophiala aquamarina CBS 119918]
MAPPGRRKFTTLILLPLLALLFLASSAHAGSAVLGIDLGTEYFKAAIAKPGSPIDIVLSKDSKRREAATIAFKPSRAQTSDDEAFPERLYGGDAVALAARFPTDVYPNLKTLLGLDASSELVEQYTARYPGLDIETIPRSDGGEGTVGFKSSSFGKRKEVFMIEELLAMELKNIKANAESQVVKGTYVTEVVITYPSFFTADEKRAIELAADLAGLRVLGLISDGLAVGLNYATSRTFDSVSEGGKPEYHLVYDVGAGCATATVLKFQGRTVKGSGKRNQTIQEVIVLGTGFDRTLGGDSLNDLIVDDMIAQFLSLPKVQKFEVSEAKIKSHGKTMAKLWKDAERLRQLLSANAVSSASFEGLYDEDLNFKYSLTRERFEKLAADHATRFGPPLSAALSSAGLQLDDLESIILHGGLVRTPFVQKELERIAGDSSKIKSNVNADEAAAMGAGFKAASLSPSFRVKDIRSTDISGSVVSIKWSTENKEKAQKLFTPSSHIGHEKQVPVKALEDITLSFTQTVHEKHIDILGVQATNLTKSAAVLQDKHGCTPANISTSFNVRLSALDGLPEVVSGSVSCETDGSKAAGVIDNVKGLFGFGSKKEDDQDVLADQELGDADSSSLTPLPVSDPTSAGSTISSVSATSSDSTVSSSTTSSSSSKPAKAAKATPTIVSVPLALKPIPIGLNAPPIALLPKLRQRLTQFDTSDQNAVSRAEALNTLEAFTYRARDYLEDDSFISASTDKDRDELEKQLSATSEWLYGDGTDANLQAFKDKLKGLKNLVDPVLKRKQEASKRPEAIKALQDGLQNLAGMIKMVEGSIEKAADDAASSASEAAASAASSTIHSTTSSSARDDLDEDPYSTKSTAESDETELPAIKPYEYTAEDLSLLTSKYDAAKAWLDKKLASQEKLSSFDDPAFLVSELETKGQELQRAVSDTLMKTIKMQDPRKPKPSKRGKSKTTRKTTSSGTSTSTSVRDEL